MTSVPVVTIDGPGGSGKGTLSRHLAKALGWHFLDSGAIYRVLALAALQQGLNLNQTDAEKRLETLSLALDVNFNEINEEVILGGKIVTAEVRSEQCGNLASKIATLAKVRQALLERQRKFCRPPGLVADGRDMGTVVFPEAFLKIYLEASVTERAKRRYLQLKDLSHSVTLQSLLAEISERDARDKERATAPLKPAEDAVVIDTTGIGIEAVFAMVMTEVKRRLYEG